MGLSILLLSLLPALIYILVIYVTTPHKKIDLETSFIYLVIGFMSVGLLKYFWMVFPEWNNIAENLMGGNPNSNLFTYFHYLYFVQVAFIEEISKLVIFLLVEKYRRRTQNVKDHPMATMFYMGMVSLGFAVIENIHYGSMYGEGVLYWRAFTSVIGHMVFGLFMGYWIAMGRIGSRLNDSSLFDIVINKKRGLRMFVYTVIGLLAATITHGIYDLHIQLNGNGGITGIYMLLVFSMLGAYWCFRNLIRVHQKKQEELKGS